MTDTAPQASSGPGHDVSARRTDAGTVARRMAPLRLGRAAVVAAVAALTTTACLGPAGAPALSRQKRAVTAPCASG
ncbi:hypothetical protein [Arthrobacter sp. H16F315]|uniref:hypothetical protein n=1 Tax=Arthrobacter sp. H16F315 TaxID=2955314 RepID=UPI0031590C3E